MRDHSDSQVLLLPYSTVADAKWVEAWALYQCRVVELSRRSVAPLIWMSWGFKVSLLAMRP